MLDVLKTFTGVHPGELTSPSSELYVFDEGHEAAGWIRDHYHPEVPVVVLPFYTESTRLHSHDYTVKLLHGTQNGHPSALTNIYWEGNKVPALLISEAANIHPYSPTGYGIYYRDSSVENVPSIVRHGLYQLPGRKFLRSSADPYIGPSQVKLAFRIADEQLIGNGDGEYALAFNPERFVRKIPRDIASKLPRPEINPLPILPETKQILAWGLATGLLGHVDTSAFDPEETLRINAQLVEQYQSPVYRKNLEQLKSILGK